MILFSFSLSCFYCISLLWSCFSCVFRRSFQLPFNRHEKPLKSSWNHNEIPVNHDEIQSNPMTLPWNSVKSLLIHHRIWKILWHPIQPPAKIPWKVPLHHMKSDYITFKSHYITINPITSQWNPITSQWNPIKSQWNPSKSLWYPIKLPKKIHEIPLNRH